jgi:hypothetical protein
MGLDALSALVGAVTAAILAVIAALSKGHSANRKRLTQVEGELSKITYGKNSPPKKENEN